MSAAAATVVVLGRLAGGATASQSPVPRKPPPPESVRTSSAPAAPGALRAPSSAMLVAVRLSPLESLIFAAPLRRTALVAASTAGWPIHRTIAASTIALSSVLSLSLLATLMFKMKPSLSVITTTLRRQT